MKEKQKNALEKILRRNHRDKIRIESLHKAALERQRTRAQRSHKHIKEGIYFIIKKRII